MPETTKKEFKLPSGETVEEIRNVFEKYYNSIIELDTNSKLIAPNLTFDLNNGFDYVTLNTEVEDAPTTVGTFYWDPQDGVPTVVLANGVKMQVGKEQFIDGLNKTGTTISNGEVVFVSGAQGNRMTVAPYDADDYSNGHKLIGLATEDVSNNATGNITTFGLVRDLDTSAYTEGDEVFVDTTAGALTTVEPSFGTGRWHAGIVVKSHVTQGEIFVNVHEDKYMFGDVDGGNYSGFESDGTLVAKGDAITYRDEYVGGQYFTPQGSSAPDQVNVTIGGVVTRKYAFDGVNTTEKLGNTHEIPHDVAVGEIASGDEEIEFHIHMAPSDNTTEGIVRWVVDWALIKSQGAPIAGTQVEITQSISAGTQYHNIIKGVALPTASEDFAIGDLIEFTISRDPTDAGDTYGADILFYKNALHVPMNTQGSRQMYVK